MVDLVLKSTHHQRYQNGVPVMGAQYCNRTIKIENKVFKEMFNGLEVTPKDGFSRNYVEYGHTYTCSADAT